MSTVNMAQPSVNTPIQYFGTAPFPTNAPLRAGNNAGIILGYRNHANTLDLQAIAINNIASDPGNHDYVVLGGAIGVQFIGGAGRIMPQTTDTVAIGDTSQRFSQLVANVVWSEIAMAHAPFTEVYTNLQTFSGAAATPATDYGLLTTNQQRLELRTGSVNGAVEVLYNGGVPANFQPTPATYAANNIILGAAGREWLQLFLRPSAAVLGAPLHIGQGIAPAAPANGDIWITAAGMFAYVAGGVVGPFAAAGAGTIALQNNGVPLAGGPFTTLDFLGGGLIDLGGGVASIPASAGGLTGGGTAGTLSIWTGATALGDSVLVDDTANYTLTGRNFLPGVNNNKSLGSQALNWNTIWCEGQLISSGTVTINTRFGGGGQLQDGSVGELTWGSQTVTGTGVEIVTGPFSVTVPMIMTNQVSGAAGNPGTLGTAPAIGDPQFWLPIKINGVQYWVPAWHV